MVRPNYNLNKFIRRCIRQMKKEYGGPITVYRLIDSTTDLDTGLRTTTRESVVVNRAVVLPNNITREAIQSISLISANKQVVQGGTYDTGTRSFIIDRSDVPQWDLQQDDWIVYDCKKYDIKSIEEFEQDTAWLIVAKEVKLYTPTQDLHRSPYNYLEFTSTATYIMRSCCLRTVEDTLGFTSTASGIKEVTEAVLEPLSLLDTVDVENVKPISSVMVLTSDVSVIKDASRSVSDTLGIADDATGAKQLTHNESVTSNFALTQNTQALIRGFVSTWNTSRIGTSNSLQITLPLESSGTYNFTVDWGDSTSNTITTWNDAAVTHTYASSGNYTVLIKGTIVGWRFDDGGDCQKLANVSQWGDLRVGNNGSYFFGCDYMTCNATDTLNISGVTDMREMWRSCRLFNQDIGDWDTSLVTRLDSMFYNADVFNQDLNSWDTANVTDMSGTFRAAETFNGDVSSWNTYKVTQINNMFVGCDAFNQDISSWNTSNVTTFFGALAGCDVFDQDISSWDVTNVTNMTGMMTGVTLSTTNYDALLIGWDAQAVNNNISFSGGSSKYSVGAATTARTNLITTNNWTIIDGGQV